MALWYIDGTVIDDTSGGFYTASDGTRYPNSWGADIPGVIAVTMTDRPTPPAGEIVTGYTVQLIDGVPTQVWLVGPIPASQILPLVRSAYVARLQGNAALLNRQGKTALATALLIQAIGAQING